MTTKEKIILQSIEVIENRLFEIEKIICYNPFTEIRKIREQAQVLLDTHKTAEEMYSASFMAQLSIFVKKEQDIIEFSQKHESTIELFDEKHKLHKELNELELEKYEINRNKPK